MGGSSWRHGGSLKGPHEESKGSRVPTTWENKHLYLQLVGTQRGGTEANISKEDKANGGQVKTKRTYERNVGKAWPSWDHGGLVCKKVKDIGAKNH